MDDRCRFASLADSEAPPTNVRFTPQKQLSVRFLPKADILRCSKERRYSIPCDSEEILGHRLS
jgi:hypothetical protein